MKIKDKPDYYAKPKPVAIMKNSGLQEAIDEMCQKNIGCIVVVNEDESVAGILTERDLMKRVLGPGRDPKDLKLEDVMTTDVHCAKEGDFVLDWLKVMSDERFRHLPVTDDHGKLINMMSQGDFVAYTWPDMIGKTMNDFKTRFKKAYQFLFTAFALIALLIILAKYPDI